MAWCRKFLQSKNLCPINFCLIRYHSNSFYLYALNRGHRLKLIFEFLFRCIMGNERKVEWLQSDQHNAWVWGRYPGEQTGQMYRREKWGLWWETNICKKLLCCLQRLEGLLILVTFSLFYKNGPHWTLTPRKFAYLIAHLRPKTLTNYWLRTFYSSSTGRGTNRILCSLDSRGFGKKTPPTNSPIVTWKLIFWKAKSPEVPKNTMKDYRPQEQKEK